MFVCRDYHGSFWFAEIKTTTHQESDTGFGWSNRETDFAFRHGHRYVIYRVFDFGHSQLAPSVVRLVSPHQLEKEGLLQTSAEFCTMAKQQAGPDCTK